MRKRKMNRAEFERLYAEREGLLKRLAGIDKQIEEGGRMNEVFERMLMDD